MDFGEILDTIVSFLKNSGVKLLEFSAFVVGGVVLAILIMRLIKRVLYKAPIDRAVSTFLLSTIKFIIVGFMVFLSLNVLGIDTSSLVAMLAAAGIAIGLALQGFLSSVANGIIIVMTKLFREGDLIDIDGVSGKVKKITMLHIELVSTDNKKIILPNNKVTSGTLINYSGRPTRRIDLDLGVSYNSDVPFTKAVILATMSGDARVLTDPAPAVHLYKFDSSSINFTARCYVLNAEYFEVSWALYEALFEAFRQNKIEIPFPQMDVHMDAPAAAPLDIRIDAPPSPQASHTPQPDETATDTAQNIPYAAAPPPTSSTSAQGFAERTPPPPTSPAEPVHARRESAPVSNPDSGLVYSRRVIKRTRQDGGGPKR
jgi:small conductance mechanosensitive channel